MDWDFFETYGAVISGVIGGIGIKIIDKMLTRRSETFVESTKLREEMRQENAALRQENRTLEAEVDLWKEKYYNKVEEVLHLPPSGSL